MATNEAKKRGGYRPGSGRKPGSNRVKISVTITPKAGDKLRKAAKRQKTSVSAVVDSLAMGKI